MLFLFLDTETTGTDNSKDQIIEVGALIYELDNKTLKLSPVSHFQSLVGLRMEMHERITRITGITHQELATAQNIIKVQESWANWLEPFDGKITAIVGHSIAFDTGFLNKEGWFLPTQQELDTLDLAKILLPDVQAVNLEFLSKRLEFENKIPIQTDQEFSHHRSLYDAIMTANLMEITTHRLNQLPLDAIFLQSLKTHLRPLSELIFYPKELVVKNSELDIQGDNSALAPNQINLKGELTEIDTSTKIQQLDKNSLQKITDLLSISLPKSLWIVAAQLYVLNIKNLQGDKKLKLHTSGGPDREIPQRFSKFIFEYLLPSSNTPEATSKHVFLNNFESIVDKMNTIQDQVISLGGIVYNLELYQLLLSTFGAKNQQIEELLVEYNFLIVSCQQFMPDGDLKLKLWNLSHQETGFVDKVNLFLSNFRKIEFHKYISGSGLDWILQIIQKNLEEKQKQAFLQQNQFYRFGYSGRFLTLTTQKPDLDLSQHFNNIITAYLSLKIQANLDSADMEDLLEMTGLQDLDFTNTQVNLLENNSEFVAVDQQEPSQYLEDLVYLSQDTNLPIFVLAGGNFSFRNIENLLSENYLMEKFMVLGESGGVTKICSKINQGQISPVLIKANQIEFFAKHLKNKTAAKVVFVDKPYFNVHNFWFNKARESSQDKNFLDDLKGIYLQSKVNKVANELGCAVDVVFDSRKWKNFS